MQVRDLASGETFAMKHMRLMGEADAIADCMTEVTTLKKLRDIPTIVTLRQAAFPAGCIVVSLQNILDLA